MNDDTRRDTFAQDLGGDGLAGEELNGGERLWESDAGSSTPATRAAAEERQDPQAPSRLGHVLREARERAGLALSDIAEVTHVRRGYLDALEAGNYAELPEDVYTRNFLRLYAQAVGIESEPILELYGSERRTAMGLTTLEQRLDRDRRTARSVSSAPIPAGRRRGGPPAWLVGPWVPTMLLIAIVVGIGLWGFNQLFAPPSGRTTVTAAVPPAAAPSAVAEPAAADEAMADAPAAPDTGGGLGGAVAPATSLSAPALAGPGGAASLTQVRVDVITEPPGASITIDGFPIPGRTPLTGIPVTGREGRVVRAELDGYESVEFTADLSVDARVDMVLTPVGAEAAAPQPETPVVAGTGGRIAITVTDTAWLEIYRSTSRNVGDRLVYTTAQSGATYAYEPPIYVYVGNAAGVRITRDGQDLGPMGSPGAVLGRAFPE